MLKIYSEISQKIKLKGKSIVDLGGLSVSATSSENLDRYWSAVKQIALSNRREVNFPKPEAYFHPEHLGIIYNSLLNLVNKGYTVEVSTYSPNLLNWLGEKIEYKEISPSDVTVQVELHGVTTMTLKYNIEGILDGFPIGYFSPKG